MTNRNVATRRSASYTDMGVPMTQGFRAAA